MLRRSAYMDIAMSGHNFWDAAYEAEQLADIGCLESCVYVNVCVKVRIMPNSCPMI